MDPILPSPVTPATGDELIQLAQPHVGEKYVFGTNVPKDNPTWKGPWDCAEFVSWVVYQAAGILYGCEFDDGNPSTADAFTGYWGRDAQRYGKVVTVAEAAQTAGAAVLRLAVPGGLGGHIVLSDGSGGTVEAHGSADGVINGKLAARRWDYGILVPGITYTAGDSVAKSLLSSAGKVYTATDTPGATPAVKRIQKALLAAGYDPGPLDGSFGPMTTAAVIAFQASKGLAPDGEVGKLTLAAMGL